MTQAKNPRERSEWLSCGSGAAYFVEEYCRIYDPTSREWAPFSLWPAQRDALTVLQRERLVVVLKARQLGLTWLVLGYSLWLMLFRPGTTVLLFSKRDDEAVHLLSVRLRGIYALLPAWLQSKVEIKASAHEWRLSNGSAALAFPTTGGRSYTATLAIVDEADFAPDLDALLNAVKPAVDAGGSLVLVSTADKSKPDSAFKRIYWGAKEGKTAWRALFLPWSARPDRDARWYAMQRDDVLARTGYLDDLYQEYPETDLEALAPRTADVRFANEWLVRCADVGGGGAEESGGRGAEVPGGGGAEVPGGGGAEVPGGRGAEERGHASAGPILSMPGLEVYRVPQSGMRYVIGADPAEGNPQSDESAATVLELETGAEVASLAGRFDPAIFAAHLEALSRAYNGAPALVERNNHGHAVILWLQENRGTWLLPGIDGRPGWLTTAKSKALAYDYAAERFRAGDARIRSGATLRQLGAVQGSTLRAPEGQEDDRAMSFVLALQAAKTGAQGTGLAARIPAIDPIEEADRASW